MKTRSVKDKAQATTGDIPVPPKVSIFQPLEPKSRRLTGAEIAALAACDVFALSHVSNPKALPPYPGVYFLIVNRQIMYVGQTWRFDVRWRRHKHRAHLSELRIRIAFLVVDRPYLRGEVERFFIKRFQPPLNRQSRPKVA